MEKTDTFIYDTVPANYRERYEKCHNSRIDGFVIVIGYGVLLVIMMLNAAGVLAGWRPMLKMAVLAAVAEAALLGTVRLCYGISRRRMSALIKSREQGSLKGTFYQDYLFIEYPDRDEGFLTQLRSKIVSRQSLNELAVKIDLDRHVISNASTSISQKHIYGDAFEAMIGAVYLDQGYEFTNRLLINRIYFQALNLDELTESETDFKSRLIEWCQKNHLKIVFRTGNDKGYSSNHPVFYSTVLVDGIEVGHGSGDSKKEAEQHAAFSVAEYMTDEQCASLLDRVDRLTQ